VAKRSDRSTRKVKLFFPSDLAVNGQKNVPDFSHNYTVIIIIIVIIIMIYIILLYVAVAAALVVLVVVDIIVA
jgi:hypothetical protein